MDSLQTADLYLVGWTAVRGRPFDSEGGWHFLEINILTFKMLEINNLSSSRKKINNLTLTC